MCVYGAAILALPFVILISLIVTRQWKLLGAYAAAGPIAVLRSRSPATASRRRVGTSTSPTELDTTVSQFVDDPRWIAMVTAMLTVAGPWLPARLRRSWWALLLAFVPIHLVVSAVVPARSLLGLAVGWFVGALVVWVVGTPALEVPLEGAVRALDRRGFVVTAITVVQPAGHGPLVLSATSRQPDSAATLEMYGENQRSGGALRQLWQRLRLRSSETPPLQTSMRRAVEYRALMAIAIGDLARRQHVDDRRRPARPGMDALRAHSGARIPDQRVRGSHTRRARVGIAATAAPSPDLARRPARFEYHRR